MGAIQRVATFLALALLLPGRAQADPKLWVHDDARHLGQLDVATGVYTPVGTTAVTFSDIAFAPDGTLYGISYPGTSGLYVIDTTTAAVSAKGSTGRTLNALVFGHDGTLYAAGGDTLVTLDPATAASTFRGTFPSYQSAGDLAFDGAGTLYLSTTSGAGSIGNLIRLDPTSAAATLVGSIGYRDVFGLAFGPNGVMYGLSNYDGVVFSIDLATGDGTYLADIPSPLTGAYGSSFFEESKPVTTTTTTSPGGTTTTTLRGGAENCTNCIDDDGDGLTDFEDPKCCDATNGLTLRHASLQAAKHRNRLELETQLTGSGLDKVNPTGQHLHVQIRAASGEVLCARIPPTAFKKKRKIFQFVDRKRTVPGTKGIDGSVVRLLKRQKLQLRVQGKQVELLQSPAAGSLRVTAAFESTNTDERANRCASVTQTFHAKGKKATLRYP